VGVTVTHFGERVSVPSGRSEAVAKDAARRLGLELEGSIWRLAKDGVALDPERLALAGEYELAGMGLAV
jgi:hypothetical protein